MFKFVVTNELGMIAVGIHTDNFLVAGHWEILDILPVPDVVKETFETLLSMNARSIYGQGLDNIEKISPVNFEHSMQQQGANVVLLRGYRKPLPERPLQDISV